MPWNRLPDVEVCCGCVPDLRTAVAIIAVLGIVTSPAVSWAVVRHAYMIRVSCLITTNQERPDVVDVNISNMLSFGFGSNTGLGSSCLDSKKNPSTESQADLSLVLRTGASSDTKSSIVKAVQIIGWIVLVSDVIFVLSSVFFLLRIFKAPDPRSAKIFMIAALVAMILSFAYSMIYVAVCAIRGGTFPVFEFIFSFFDLLIWAYFLIVVNSYRRRIQIP